MEAPINLIRINLILPYKQQRTIFQPCQVLTLSEIESLLHLHTSVHIYNFSQFQFAKYPSRKHERETFIAIPEFLIVLLPRRNTWLVARHGVFRGPVYVNLIGETRLGAICVCAKQ